MTTHIHMPYRLHAEQNRAKSAGPNIQPFRHGLGYCEGCKSNKPRPPKAVKGWRCKECKSNEGE